ncbi:O-antigen ligase family protein [Mycolicibacterium sp. CBM1]
MLLQSGIARIQGRAPMADRWVTIAWLPIAFLAGFAVAIDNRAGIAALAIAVIALLVRFRLRPINFATVRPTNSLRPDWILVLVPTVLAFRTFSEKFTLAMMAFLVAAAFLRKSEFKYTLHFGPMLCLLAASAIVYSRPANYIPIIIFALVVLLILRVASTVDGRAIVSSLIDGCGLYLVANVVGVAAGLQSPAAEMRIGGLVESTGFVRTIYPFTTTLNAPPTIASIYVVAFAFVILEPGLLRRIGRSTFLIAALIVLAGAGSRTPITISAILSITVICFPKIIRWLGQATTIFAAVSVLLLPWIVNAIYFVIAPALTSLARGRVSDAESITSIEGREIIWRRSLDYWGNWVNDPMSILLGYGVNGQYRSGASLGYKEFISSIVRNPELASVHNSFLQQLFDGGIIGWLLLTVAIVWASTRLARQRAWGTWALAGTVGLTVLTFSGMTEVSVSPGPSQDTFWILTMLVGISCQAAGKLLQSKPTADVQNQGDLSPAR